MLGQGFSSGPVCFLYNLSCTLLQLSASAATDLPESDQRLPCSRGSRRIAPVRVVGAVSPIQRRRFRLTLTSTAQGLGISPNAANFDYMIRD